MLISWRVQFITLLPIEPMHVTGIFTLDKKNENQPFM